MAGRNRIPYDRLDDFYFMKESIIQDKIEILRRKNVPDKTMQDIILEERLQLVKENFCEGCKHRTKDLDWHKRNEVSFSSFFDSGSFCYVFECSHMEKEEQE